MIFKFFQTEHKRLSPQMFVVSFWKIMQIHMIIIAPYHIIIKVE